MLCVKTKLQPSLIHGIGLFANQTIAKRAVIWRNNDCISYNKYSAKEWKRLERELTKESFEQIKRYAYMHDYDKCWRIDLDDTRFINHSDKPNAVIDKSGDLVAVRKIGKGEEIFINYEREYVR